MATAVEQAATITAKKIAAFKNRFEKFVADIKVIRDAGRTAARDSSANDAFLGAHASLANRFDKCEACYFDLEEYCIAHNYDGFPSQTDLDLLADAKRYRNEANALHVNITRTLQIQGRAEASVLEGQSTNSTVIRMPTGPKLPDINLPTFSGEILDWPFFRDSFKATIHNKPELSKIDKFSYLLGLLKSTALETIKSVPLSESNYDVAWQRLTNKYDNQRHLASAYINKFLNAKPIQRANLSNLEHFISTVIAAVENFKTLTIAEREDYLLFEILVRYLDPTTRQSFENSHVSHTHPTYQQLKAFLETQQQQLSRASLGCSPIERQSNANARPIERQGTTIATPNRFQPRKSTSFYTFNTPMSNKFNKSVRQPEIKLSCFLCSQNHEIASCAKFKNVSPRQRFEMLRFWKGCRKCLQSGDARRRCSCQETCKTCNGKHNTLLHFAKSNETICPSSSSNLVTNEPSTVALTSFGTVGQSSLLGTAVALIKDSKGTFQSCRLVIDSGSQHSYLSKACAHRLGLTCLERPCYVSGLNNSNVSVSEGTVNCTLKPFKSKLEFSTTAHIIPVITTMLPREPVPVEFIERLPNVKLADPYFGTPGQIDFLLGADLFMRILKPSSGHPSLLNTVFGHVVMGPLNVGDHTSVALFATHSFNESANKVKETGKNMWHHINSKDYSSYRGSKGLHPQKLAHRNSWRNGPSWLASNPIQGPTQQPVRQVKRVNSYGRAVKIYNTALTPLHSVHS